ncbi:hypothetical protein [Aestuariivirga sp.]|uniref:hypothetical protein n=1 Tax=Aestuariivirga sp. TaxID=2650926 RepID=UPI0039E403EC
MSRCIYCDEAKPFTDEHVVSAGLGGDDKGWMLRDCVCGDCNTKVFSKLEAKFLRSSPVAIARLFHQEKTRGRGRKTGAPTLNTQQTLMEDRAKGIFLNQDLRQGFEPVILPQVVLESPGTLSAHMQDVATGRAFLSSLQASLAGDLLLIRKIKVGLEVAYEHTPLTWNATTEEYVASPVQISAKAPNTKDGVVWVEELIMPSTARSASRLTPRIYRRNQGQLVCAVVDLNDARGVLTLLRRNGGAVVVPEGAVPIEIESEGVHLKLAMSIAVHDRVLTKIGINLAAYLFDPDFVRRPEFAETKSYALTGKGHVLKIHADRHPSNQLGEANQLPGVHVFCITPANSGNDDSRLLSVMISLYGGPFESFALAELPKGTPELNDPIIILVFYNENRIERFSMNDLHQMAEADGLGSVN